jgi:hypothetical protein
VSDKVTQLHTPRSVPPPEPTPREKLVARSKGVGHLDHVRYSLADAIREFTHSGDEGTKDAAVELRAEVEAILDGLAVGR